MKWDNLNQVTTNIHENNVHTEGIMIKEVKRDIDMNATIHERTLSLYNTTDSRYIGKKWQRRFPIFSVIKRLIQIFLIWKRRNILI